MSINANDLTFGIEIECYIPTAAFNAAGWVRGAYHMGRAVPGFPGWRLDSDGSLTMETPAGHTAVEVVSPVLKGAEGFANMRRMVAQLNLMGATVKKSCGFHVHVGWQGEGATFPALRRLVCLVAQHEKALFASTGTRSRERNGYCPSIRTGLAQIQQMTTIEELVRDANVPRGTLNLRGLLEASRGYGGKRTVEFRIFSGTVNAEKIAAYISLCLAFVQRAQTSKVAVKWDSKRKALAFRKTEGLNAITRLFAALGWTAAMHILTPYGIVDGEQVKAKREELQRLARKYDAAAPAQVTSW
jgi:hypothetical protein